MGLVDPCGFDLLPRFHLSANGGKKYNNDEANQAASSDDQRLSEIVPDGLVKSVRKLQYFKLDQDSFHCAIRLFLASSTLF